MEEEKLVGRIFNQIHQMHSNYTNFARMISFLEEDKFFTRRCQFTANGRIYDGI